jgi:glycosyltransferase involved in cell wall biosynthesis
MKRKDNTVVCYVLAYREPKYIRSRVLLNILKNIQNVETKTAINTTKSLFRYFETLAKVSWKRIRYKPNVYIIGFSGYEIYWPVRFLTWPKPLIFDEFINAYEWFVKEHALIKEKSFISKILRWYVRSILKNSRKILTDTMLHAKSSAFTYGIPLSKYQTLYVGTDENLFEQVESKVNEKEFIVFFYGNFLPLHGMEYILDAARLLQGLPIKFVIIGGVDKEREFKKFTEYTEAYGLTNIQHHSWVDFEELPRYIAEADLCLGGPFGGTPQSQKVITGKTFQFLAMCKPVIVGRIEEESGLIDKENCLLVPQKSGNVLAGAITWGYNHPDELKKIGQKGYELYYKSFSTQALTPTLSDILYDVVKN